MVMFTTEIQTKYVKQNEVWSSGIYSLRLARCAFSSQKCVINRKFFRKQGLFPVSNCMSMGVIEDNLHLNWYFQIETP